MSSTDDWTPELVARKLQALNAEASEDAPEEPLRAAAAVVYEFDPAMLNPIGELSGAREEAVKRLLADCISTRPAQYLLKPQARREALIRLRSREAIAAAIAANLRPEDPYQRVLSDYVRGAAVPALENQSVEELGMTSHVLWLLDGLLDNLPSAEAVRRAIDARSILDWLAIIAGPNFSGRERELRAIREFVGIASPRTAAVRRLRDVRQPLAIYGPGGVGKSALVARFILDSRADPGQELPFAYLSFDRPAMAVEHPARLLAGAARQLGVPFGPPPEARPDAIMREFARALADAGLQETSWLLVLDAIEEVQYAGGADALAALLASLQTHAQAIRIILVSRVKPGGFPMSELQLSGFDTASADAFLKRRGIEDADVRESITRTVGANPLSLNLAAEFIVRAGPTALQHIPSPVFGSPETVVQGALIGRILDHIHDVDVRRLAPAALVLRRITPELIFSVVAPVRGVPLSDMAAARQIFEGFRREVPLTSRTESGSLFFRTDVRRTMLPLLSANEPETVRRIHSSAAEYYAHRSSVEDRAEEMYHLLSLGADPTVLDSRWQPEAGLHLRGSVEELPLAAREWLQARLTR